MANIQNTTTKVKGYTPANPMFVEVVTPEVNFGVEMARLVVGAPIAFLYALIAWWLGPLIFPEFYELGYWQTFALIFFLRVLIPRPASPRYRWKA